MNVQAKARRGCVVCAVAMCAVIGSARADQGAGHGAALPAGPIRDRHELMEEIGRHAKRIKTALEKNQVAAVAEDAEAIASRARKIKELFPPGSTHEKSRARPEIWTERADFERLGDRLVAASEALAASARSGGEVKKAAQEVFSACKPCHDKFRAPEK